MRWEMKGGRESGWVGHKQDMEGCNWKDGKMNTGMQIDRLNALLYIKKLFS